MINMNIKYGTKAQTQWKKKYRLQPLHVNIDHHINLANACGVNFLGKVMKEGEPSENLNKINEAIKSSDAQEVTVQEFVGLVSPYTSDNGMHIGISIPTQLVVSGMVKLT